MMRPLAVGVVLAGLLLSPVPARAQSPGVRAYFTYGAVSLTSSDTFKAVADTNRAMSLGGGIQATGLWRSLFVDVGFSRQSLDGTRVFVFENVVYPLDIPLEASFTPIDVTAGWRFDRRQYAPYVGGGLSLIGYNESSSFARAGDDVSERGTGFLFLAGVDVPVGRFLALGGELRYRAVSGVLGDSGASAVFGEDQLGGIQYSIRISVPF
jgi:hypothetical protein